MQLLKKQPSDRIGLIGHTIINYPNQKDAEAIIDILVNNQVDLIELQIPFSEPVADGPLFTKANHEALISGVTLSDCFDFMAHVTTKYSIPFVFMTYANVVFRLGYEQFITKAKAVGAKGAIIPDLPLDIATDYVALCQEMQFAAIPIVAPNISDQRLKTISPYFDGFIYAVSRSGVTGSKTELDPSIKNYIKRLREYSQLPIAVGFGIASAHDLNFFRGSADYAVVGSQTLRTYYENGLEGVQHLWRKLSEAQHLLK